MCGIFFSLSKHSQCMPDPSTRECLKRRGPDAYSERGFEIQAGGAPGEPLYATIVSTVLSLRGEHIVSQPLVDSETKSFLCWNGEAWSISGDHLKGLSERFAQHYASRIAENDTEAVFKLLLNATSRDTHDETISYQPVLEAVSLISGPYAFVYYDAKRQCIFYARDSLGRRSLLQRTNARGDFMLTSSSLNSEPLHTEQLVIDPNRPDLPNISDQWEEVEADGIYILDLTGKSVKSHFHVRLDDNSKVKAWNWHEYNWVFFPYAPKYTRFDWADPFVTMHYGLLNPATSSTFDPNGSTQDSLPEQLTPLSLDSLAVSKLETLLRHSLDLRLHGLGTPDIFLEGNDHSCKLAVLFSGGLDCTLLARLAHEVLPHAMPIDLLNVAFENPRIHSQKTTVSAYEQCPDRITGRKSHAELQGICPGRSWQFVEINVPYTETLSHRDTIISLISPHKTEMDLSIAMALYFASRGVGVLQSNEDATPQPYTTPARVLLSGLGADELFAGYQRHAVAFSRNGFVGQPGAPGLIDELQLDVSRLGKRNLGRDDRVLSHWARETRFPYLDESLVDWATSAPVWEKTGFGVATTASTTIDPVANLEPGKKVLRVLAYKLGLKGVAAEKKRAIQFGARTAKMTTGKTKGTTLLS